MLPIRTIVHPIDFAPADHTALQHSAHFARYYGAALHVVHVAPPMGPLPAHDARHAREAAALYEQAMRGHVSALVRAFVRAAGVHGVRVEPVFIPHAFPAAGIVDYAQSVEADLLVTGAHRGRGPWAPLLGSVAEAVVRAAPCPVLVVRPEGASALVRRVVAALDLSPADEETAAYAVSLAEVYDAPLELLHVVEPAEEPVLAPSNPSEGYAQRLEGLELRAQAELDALRARLVGEGRAMVHVETGPAPEVVVSCATSEEQLLVLGRRGPAGGRRLDFHGVTEKALRAARCSVFIVSPERPPVTSEPPSEGAARAPEAGATGGDAPLSIAAFADQPPPPARLLRATWSLYDAGDFRPMA